MHVISTHYPDKHGLLSHFIPAVQGIGALITEQRDYRDQVGVRQHQAAKTGQ